MQLHSRPCTTDVVKHKSIDLSEVLPGMHVRMTDDMPPLIWAIDLVMAVTGKNNDYAGQQLRNVINSNLFSRDRITEKNMPGRGNAHTKLVTFEDAYILIQVLPGTMAAEARVRLAGLMRRYQAGDLTLVQEILDNAGSNAPLNAMARASLGIQPVLQGGAGDGWDGDENDDDDDGVAEPHELRVKRMRLDMQAREWTMQKEMMDQYNSVVNNWGMDANARAVFGRNILSLASQMLPFALDVDAQPSPVSAAYVQFAINALPSPVAAADVQPAIDTQPSPLAAADVQPAIDALHSPVAPADVQPSPAVAAADADALPSPVAASDAQPVPSGAELASPPLVVDAPPRAVVNKKPAPRVDKPVPSAPLYRTPPERPTRKLYGPFAADHEYEASMVLEHLPVEDRVKGLTVRVLREDPSLFYALDIVLAVNGNKKGYGKQQLIGWEEDPETPDGFFITRNYKHIGPRKTKLVPLKNAVYLVKNISGRADAADRARIAKIFEDYFAMCYSGPGPA